MNRRKGKLNEDQPCKFDNLDLVTGKDKKIARFAKIISDAADLMGIVAALNLAETDTAKINMAKFIADRGQTFDHELYGKTIKGLRDLYTKGVAREQVGAIMQYIQEGFYRIEETAYKNKK